MPGRLDGLADRGDVVDDARRGIDLHHENHLDLALGILSQPGFDIGRPDGAPQIAFQHLHLDAHRGGGFTPADREAPALQHQDLVAA